MLLRIVVYNKPNIISMPWSITLRRAAMIPIIIGAESEGRGRRAAWKRLLGG